jgi:hypothetical protein
MRLRVCTLTRPAAENMIKRQVSALGICAHVSARRRPFRTAIHDSRGRALNMLCVSTALPLTGRNGPPANAHTPGPRVVRGPDDTALPGVAAKAEGRLP